MSDHDFKSINGYASIFVNSIPGIEYMSYFELGIGYGQNFNNVKCKEKVSVDINRNCNPTHCMTTDRFFLHNKDKFDVGFIDADHKIDQVFKDFKNSILVCNKYLLIHDLIPAKEEYVSFDKCGDSYKLLYYLVEKKGLKNNILTLDGDCGLSILHMPLEEQFDHLSDDVRRLNYKNFMDWLNQYKMYRPEQIISILKGGW